MGCIRYLGTRLQTHALTQIFCSSIVIEMTKEKKTGIYRVTRYTHMARSGKRNQRREGSFLFSFLFLVPVVLFLKRIVRSPSV